MGYRGVPVRRPRPTHVQAKIDSKRRQENQLLRTKELAYRRTAIRQAQWRESTRPMWRSLRRARGMRRLGAAYGLFGIFLLGFGAGPVSLLSIAGGFGVAFLFHRIAKTREQAIVDWHYPAVEQARDELTSINAKLFELHGMMDEVVEHREAEEQCKAEQARDEASWQAIIYGEHSLYTTTQRAIDEIDRELNAIAEEQRAEVERQAAEEAEIKWRAMPAEMRAMGCEQCRSMSHPGEVCVAGPLVAQRKQIEGEWITTWGTPEPIIGKPTGADFSEGGIVRGNALLGQAFDSVHETWEAQLIREPLKKPKRRPKTSWF
jgi:hypothetical protein